jgi:Glycosyl transferase family 2
MRSLRARVKGSPVLRAAAFLAQSSAYGAVSALTPAAPRSGAGATRHHLAAMIRVKDEARFLPEWLAHHLNLGVEHVYIYDNNSTDDIASVVAPFLERDLATCVPWPNVPASPSCHIDFLDRFGPRCDWVAFFDADEFLVERTPGDLADVLASTSAPAIAVNWRYFGSAGHETIPRGLVTQRFDRADATSDHHIKVIARPAAVHRYRNSHNFYFHGGRLARTTDGRRVFGSFVRPPAAPRLELRHYVYRSREDYERKARHGFVDASGAKDRARLTKLAASEFDRHNEVLVETSPEVLRGTASLLAELGYPDDIVGSSSGVHPPATRPLGGGRA